MSLLTPLGLLGLIGLIVLLIIYIIKPNYQTKYISSTYVWKMSLKYKRKKIPLNTLRNILLFICQVLAITAAAFILAQPFIDNSDNNKNGDTIIIIDASASMQADTNEETRFERAANQAFADAEKALRNGNKVTLIVAADEASFLVQQASKDQTDLVNEAFASIINEPETFYTFGTPDIDGAMKLAEQITSYTENVSVTLYTDTSYANSDKVNVVNVANSSEWNAAILDVRATMVENYYRIEIDVASYASDIKLDVNCEIMNMNDTGTSFVIEKDVYCSNDETVTLIYGFKSPDMSEAEAALIDEEVSVFSFEQIYVNIKTYDSFDYDNSFSLYGGQKPTIKVLYYSILKNDFYPNALMVLDSYIDEWNIDITEVKEGEPEVEGYDIYIFEHKVPATLPTDGIVILSDPDKMPSSSGVRLGAEYTTNGPAYFTSEETHGIMKSLCPEEIYVTKFRHVVDTGDFKVLAAIDSFPMLLVNEDVDQKMVIMPFSLHYSNMALLPEFPLLLNNVISYFFPVTLKDGHSYEINNTVSLNARAETLDITGPGIIKTFEELPTEITVVKPGTYTLMQTPISGITVIENFYVAIPDEESNINLKEETLTNPYFYSDDKANNVDLLFYFALALVALLLIEWWLKSREET